MKILHYQFDMPLWRHIYRTSTIKIFILFEIMLFIYIVSLQVDVKLGRNMAFEVQKQNIILDVPTMIDFHANLIPKISKNPHSFTIQELTGVLTYKNFTSINQEHISRQNVIVDHCRGKKEKFFGRTAQKWAYEKMSFLKEYNLLYCPVPKIGSTFWRRLLFSMNYKIPIYTPYDIPIQKALKSLNSKLCNVTNELFENSLKMIFVREPFTRLLSGYIDKLFAPNPFYWTTIGRYIINKFRKNPSTASKRCGHDVTFSEFVKYVVFSEENYSKPLDPHFSPIYNQCKPCEIKYNMIGKMESFEDDTAFILNNLGFNVSEQLIQKWAMKAEEDAIIDSTISPFNWKLKIKHCMTMYKAGQRIWRKLQIRGIIDIQESMPFKLHNMKNVSSTDFMQALIIARNRSKHDKKKQKHEALIDAFNQVSTEDKLKFAKLFSPDFELFDYDPRPSYIFNESVDRKSFESVYFNFKT